MTISQRTRRAVAATAAALVVGTGLTQVSGPADAAGAVRATDDHQTPLGILGDAVPGLDDLRVPGRVLPSALQRRTAAGLGPVSLRWNQYGTPASLLPRSGSLGRATSSNPVAAARTWLGAHHTLFGLSRAQITGLDLVNDARLTQSRAHAVLFRQRYGDLIAARNGMVVVGVANGQIAYVASSLARTSATPSTPVLSPLQGWLKAAANVGRIVTGDDRAAIESVLAGGWTRLVVPGFAQEQQVRLRALALPDGRVRPVFEANVVDTEAGVAFAYTSLVDAVTGSVLVRQNQVENESDIVPFQGTLPDSGCSARYPFQITDNKTKQIAAAVTVAPDAEADIKLRLYGPAGSGLSGGADLAPQPEYFIYKSDNIPAGVYGVEVCVNAAPLVPSAYAGTIILSEDAVPGAGDDTLPPRWRYFVNQPSQSSTSVKATPTNSIVGCWTAGKGCTSPTGPLANLANVGPWDTVAATGLPSFTTLGNNANTHEAWASPLTPGGLLQAPYAPNRQYTTKFTDAWNNSECDPSELTPGGNDIDFTVGNLFVTHNRMHDWSYFLGFTEKNYNMQLDNLGRGGIAGDNEVGNVQAGAISGGQPLQLGRDNANQITLQDGVSGITNQYLFQPIAGAFYAPCTDGSLDMGIVGHEYTHAISNRMIGGPDEGITSEQGGAMGESWGDLDAGEYLFANGYMKKGAPWAVGAYATGNTDVAIRDYAIDDNPLNYSDYGFDTPGPEVHADGEIWNGTQWSVRQGLVRKWNKKFPYNDRKLQAACAMGTANGGPTPPQFCPGNRRWIQLVFDAFLLQLGPTSMLDARDAMLAADKMRFGGADQKVMWKAFAQRGMGKGASVASPDNTDPVPSFASAKGGNATITFKAPAPGQVFVGDYEARVSPVADTLAATKLSKKASFVAGTYRMLYVSAKGGFTRFTMTVEAGRNRVESIKQTPNLAAAKNGARVIAATKGSLHSAALIDGTEATNWAGITAANVDKSHPSVAVDLAGGTHVVRRVQVSALLRPVVDGDADQDSASRFTALRRFALEACVKACATSKARWQRFFVSSPNAFPAQRPRPVAPDEILRSFAVPATRAAAIRLVALENQCTGYAGYAGEIDNDPLNDTDCKTASDRGTIVHAAELQVFGR